MKRFTLSTLLLFVSLFVSGQTVETVTIMEDTYQIPGHTVTVMENGQIVVYNSTMSQTTVGLYDRQRGNFNQYFRLRKGENLVLPVEGSTVKVFNVNAVRSSTPANGVTITRMIRDSELPLEE